MARKAKKARRAPKETRKAPKQTTGINEAALTKGEVRKLNALRKSVGAKIAEQAFTKWLRDKPKAGSATPRDRHAENDQCNARQEGVYQHELDDARQHVLS